MKPTSLRPKSEQKMSLEQITEALKKATAKRGIILKTLEVIDRVKSEIEGPLWKHIKETLGKMVDGVDRLEDQSDKYSPAEFPVPDRIIWKSLGVKKAARGILAIEGMVNNEEDYRDTLAKVEADIKELNERKSQLA